MRCIPRVDQVNASHWLSQICVNWSHSISIRKGTLHNVMRNFIRTCWPYQTLSRCPQCGSLLCSSGTLNFTLDIMLLHPGKKIAKVWEKQPLYGPKLANKIGGYNLQARDCPNNFRNLALFLFLFVYYLIITASEAISVIHVCPQYFLYI